MKDIPIHRYVFSAVGLAIIGLALPPATAAAQGGAPGQIIVQQTVLGPAPTDMRDLAITPDGKHAALAATMGSRRVVSIDGNEGQPYSAIVLVTPISGGHGQELLSFSPDKTCLAYVAGKGS